MNKQITAIIPSRYHSTRFPGKPLANIKGKSMIQRVYEQAAKAGSINQVLVATDHKKIYDHVLAFGGHVVMTSHDHKNGTERCFEAWRISRSGSSSKGKPDDFIVNIQGDEPFIKPKQIETLISTLNKPTIEIATLAKKIDNDQELFDPHIVKVIFDKDFNAIYFSRQTIPYLKGIPESKWLHEHSFYKHIGIYAYRSDILEKITKLPPSPLEQSESLEQLRWIENGYKIKVAITEIDSIGIDTKEDIIRIS